MAAHSAPDAATVSYPARARVDRIVEECASPLGFAQRGVSSWDQDWLNAVREREGALDIVDEYRLLEIELQVFGEAAYG